MSRKQLKRRAGGLTKYVIVGFFILAVACGVGFTAASAESSDEVASANAFGYTEQIQTASAQNYNHTASTTEAQTKGTFADQHSLLVQQSARSLESGFQIVDHKESAEQQRLDTEKAEALSRVETQKLKQETTLISSSEAQVVSTENEEYELPEVNWSVSHDDFVSEWTARIDAFLAGSNLSGYGSVFAEAAWNCGVDPRWSPAIAYTESSRGAICFLPYNAWGWGYRSWSDWTSAINEHVAGLSSIYGYSLTREAAQSYCPPNAHAWYETVYRQMASM